MYVLWDVWLINPTLVLSKFSPIEFLHNQVCVDIAAMYTVYGHCSSLLVVLLFCHKPVGLAFRVGTPPLLMIATNTATYACGIGDRIVEVQCTV